MPRRLQVLTRTAGRVAGAQQRRGSRERHYREDMASFLRMLASFLRACGATAVAPFGCMQWRSRYGEYCRDLSTAAPIGRLQLRDHVVTGIILYLTVHRIVTLRVAGSRMWPAARQQLIAATNFSLFEKILGTIGIRSLGFDWANRGGYGHKGGQWSAIAATYSMLTIISCRRTISSARPMRRLARPREPAGARTPIIGSVEVWNATRRVMKLERDAAQRLRRRAACRSRIGHSARCTDARQRIERPALT